MALVANKSDLEPKRGVATELGVISFSGQQAILFPFCFVSEFIPVFFLLHFTFVILLEGEQFAQEHGMFYIETSAKSAENINELFHEIGKMINDESHLSTCQAFVLIDILLEQYKCSSESNKSFSSEVCGDEYEQ
ncbi:hypothetical protein Fmac_012532 [Flemingia macrophylla]|uniref:Uncharacterized protein n=1 Tax=Flemingia macrophylla TaxID=520843 RepID=A0ABD1MQZ1_9FABA